MAAAADEADQLLHVGLFLEHVEGSHHAVGAAQVGGAVVLGPGPFGPLAGLDGGDDRVALLQVHAHAEDGRPRPAADERPGRPFAERAVRLAQALDLLGPAREIGRDGAHAPRARRSTSGLPRRSWRWPRNRRWHRQSSALSAIFSSAAASRPIAVVTTSGLPPGVCAKPPPLDLARLHERDAAGDIGDGAAHVVEHAKARIRGPEGRGLSRAGGESPVVVLMSRGVGCGLGELGGRLGTRPAPAPTSAARTTTTDTNVRRLMGWSSPVLAG